MHESCDNGMSGHAIAQPVLKNKDADSESSDDEEYTLVFENLTKIALLDGKRLRLPAI